MKKHTTSRRSFINTALIAGTAGVVSPSGLFAAERDSADAKLPRPKVLFFDVNETLLDLTAMKPSVGKALNNRTELLPLWFTNMLQYSLVVTTGNKYFDFGAIGAAALQMVARNNNIPLSKIQAKEAIKPILSLPPHKEVAQALAALKAAGYIMVSFTNSSNKAAAAQLDNAGIAKYFYKQLSIEDVGKFKPHVDAYNWAARKMGVSPGDCMLVAAHGWDVAGAKWAGWQTAFLSRPGQQLFPLADAPDYNSADLIALAKELVTL